MHYPKLVYYWLVYVWKMFWLKSAFVYVTHRFLSLVATLVSIYLIAAVLRWPAWMSFIPTVWYLGAIITYVRVMTVAKGRKPRVYDKTA